MAGSEPGAARSACVGAVLDAARLRLKSARVPTAALDAEVLLAHVLGASREYLKAHPDQALTSAQRKRHTSLITRRARHVPVAYLTGTREFFGLPLRVTPFVLIPRPETEILVERALEFLHANPGKRCVIDLGTGSGAIAVAIAHAVPDARVEAIDRSQAALAVARRNARALGVFGQVRFRRADLLSGARPADLIAANLPYLSAARRRRLPPEVRREPAAALNGGPDGLRLIRRALRQAPAVLRPAGCALFECDPAQARSLGALARRAWPGARIDVARDLSGQARVVQVRVR